MTTAQAAPPAILYITYPGTPEDRFDRDYYLGHHLPRARAAYTQYGLQSITAFFPAVEQAGTVALCEFHFADAAAIATAFKSPEAADMRADIPNFTELTLQRARALPMDGDEADARREPTGPVTLFVTYQGTSETRFDRAYYVEHHLPLVMKAWSHHGLEGVAAFFPAVGPSGTGTIAICECRFRDEEAVSAAFSSGEAPAVMADVPRFTDAAPARARAVAP